MLLGDSGTGKTRLLIALGIAARVLREDPLCEEQGDMPRVGFADEQVNCSQVID